VEVHFTVGTSESMANAVMLGIVFLTLWLLLTPDPWRKLVWDWDDSAPFSAPESWCLKPGPLAHAFTSRALGAFLFLSLCASSYCRLTCHSSLL